MKKFNFAFIAFIAFSSMANAQNVDTGKIYPMDKSNPRFSECGKGIYANPQIFFNFYFNYSLSRKFLDNCPMTSSPTFDVEQYKKQTMWYGSADAGRGLASCYSRDVANKMENDVKRMLGTIKDFCNNTDVMKEVGTWFRFVDTVYRRID